MTGTDPQHEHDDHEHHESLPSGPISVVPTDDAAFKGKVSDFFTKVKVLGEGSAGRVFLVWANTRKKFVALKVSSKRDMIKLRRVPRALNEREILATVKHPFVMHFYGSFQTEKYCYFVMEHCSGGELYKLIQKQPNKRLPEAAVKFYAAEVVLALEYLHSLGVVVRDLKPENVLVDAKGHLRLTDFDLSKITHVDAPNSSSIGAVPSPNVLSPRSKEKKKSLFSKLFSSSKSKSKAESPKNAPSPQVTEASVEPHERLMSFVGTMEYIAPEVIHGKGYDGAVDWWTLGILMYEMLYGKTPFVSTTANGTFQNIVTRELTFPSTVKVSPECKSLIKNLLKRDPSERLGRKAGAAEIKAHAFFRGLNWNTLPLQTPPIVPPKDTSVDPSQIPDPSKETDDIFASEMVSPQGAFINFPNVRRGSLVPVMAS